MHLFPHVQCKYFINEYHIGFILLPLLKGETYEGENLKYHNIVFLLEGKLQFSCNEYLNRYFEKGDLFFTSQASNVYAHVLEDARLLVLTFNSQMDSLCDMCSLMNYVKQGMLINYDFKPLPMTSSMWNFALLMEEYINKDMKCAFLHQLKQKELFVLFQYCYTEEEILELFYPAIGMVDFKAKVLEDYSLDKSLVDLAEMYHMTPKTFSRRFKKEFNMTFRKWVVLQKAKRIKLKLSTPGTTFNDIVRDFNFADSHHFYRFCKEQYGCTATKFVAQLRDDNAVV